jgi:hypothetical protein
VVSVTDPYVRVLGLLARKLSLTSIYYILCHEGVWGSGGIALPFLTLTLNGGEWSASRPGSFTIISLENNGPKFNFNYAQPYVLISPPSKIMQRY